MQKTADEMRISDWSSDVCSSDLWLDRGWLDNGPFDIGWLRPRQLFRLVGWDSLTHGPFWSLLLNVGSLFLVSARWRPGFDESRRNAPFIRSKERRVGKVHGKKGRTRGSRAS